MYSLILTFEECCKIIQNIQSPTGQAADQVTGHDVEEGNKSKTGGAGGGGEVSAPPASHPRKPPVEDRALQAILAARRRSLENAGKAEPVGGPLGGCGWVKDGGCICTCAPYYRRF